MNEIAEQGFAAHWKYKEGEEVTEDEGELNDWLRTIKEILDDPQPDAMDFLDAIKLNLFASEIFVFTPKGEIKMLPAGCTALDFAFQLHTFLGSHCIGAKVNHRLVPLSHRLQSGDQVEILTSKSQHVDPSWINFVSTAKARGKIQAILRRANRELQKQGENILKEWLAKHNLEQTTPILDKLCELHELQKPEELLQHLGDRTVILGEKDLDEILGKKKSNVSFSWLKRMPFMGREKRRNKTEKDEQNLLVVGKDFNKKLPCIITETSVERYIFPSCCHPIPGDEITGFVTRTDGVSVHRVDCTNVPALQGTPERLVKVTWDKAEGGQFPVTIQVEGIDRSGLLADVSRVISDLHVDILEATLTSGRNKKFSGRLTFESPDPKHLNHVLKQVRRVPGVYDAFRTNS